MDELFSALRSADEDYLVGLSNKGIFKRAVKELDTAAISAVCSEGSAYVNIDKEKCLIKLPLPDCQCTCPSRGICRHIITAILWMKNEYLTETQPEKTDTPEEKPIYTQLKEFDRNKLVKAMKKKYYAEFLEKAKLGFLPSLEELSVITAELPDENAVVKLMSPLEYSVCSCHSKDLCRHKAAAILTWQLKHKVIGLDALPPPEDTKKPADEISIQRAADYSLTFLKELLSEGLVRASDNITEQAQTAALMCHNSRIAEGERLFREIGNRLESYIGHSPEFDVGVLTTLLLDGICLFRKISQPSPDTELDKLIGEFRSNYSITDTLLLLPVCKRNFSSAAGYEGEIYYFLSKSPDSQKRFYTYSDIRPTFYENTGKRRISMAPWGLFGPADDLAKYEIRLHMPKISGIKLSSSGDTKGEYVCKRNLAQKCVSENVYTDYRKLITDLFSQNYHKLDDTERPVLFSPKQVISSETDEISQTHSIITADNSGKKLTVRLRYHNDIKDFFTSFCQAGEMMKSQPEKRFVIFGTAYIENGQCIIYPLNIFDNIPVTDTPAEEELSSENNIYTMITELLDEVRSMLSDILQSGADSYSEYSAAETLAADCENAGLLTLAAQLKQLSDILRQKTHSLYPDPETTLNISAEIHQYIRTAGDLIAYKSAIEKLSL